MSQSEYERVLRDVLGGGRSGDETSSLSELVRTLTALNEQVLRQEQEKVSLLTQTVEMQQHNMRQLAALTKSLAKLARVESAQMRAITSLCEESSK